MQALFVQLTCDPICRTGNRMEITLGVEMTGGETAWEREEPQAGHGMGWSPARELSTNLPRETIQEGQHGMGQTRKKQDKTEQDRQIGGPMDGSTDGLINGHTQGRPGDGDAPRHRSMDERGFETSALGS